MSKGTKRRTRKPSSVERVMFCTTLQQTAMTEGIQIVKRWGGNYIKNYGPSRFLLFDIANGAVEELQYDDDFTTKHQEWMKDNVIWPNDNIVRGRVI